MTRSESLAKQQEKMSRNIGMNSGITNCTILMGALCYPCGGMAVPYHLFLF